MAIINDLLDEYSGLADARVPWETYWRNIAMYVLPHTQSFDSLISSNADAAINSVVSTPIASKRSKELYDMTSLWAIERLTAGMLSLKTPESQNWHDLGTNSFFGEEPTHEEAVALEKLRNYLFKVRANPNTGFWGAHKAAVRSMCAFGDGWIYTEEMPGRDARTPFRYSHMPLTELYPGMDPSGQPNRMARVFRLSAEQAVRFFNTTEDTGRVPATVLAMANDPKQRHHRVRVLHMVRPRDDGDKAGKVGVHGSAFESHYAFPDDKHMAGSGGFFEFPFTRYAWNQSGVQPYSEGPVACAIGELKSLQEMAKNELIAVQTSLRPAYGTHGKNFVKLNFNPGATNPGLITAEGRPLFQPLNTGTRPDFAQGIMESRRNSVRELLYLNLWQIIVQDKGETATEALIRAQEKGELLGPVGISLNAGLAHLVDREVAILGRKNAFDDGSPLAMPDSLKDAEVAPRFTSPLDRLRRVGELIGMQRLVEFATLLAGGDPQRAQTIMARFDVDEMLEQAQQILGAPVSTLVSKEQADNDREQAGQMAQSMAALQTLKAGGEAATAVGQGGQALAGGAVATQDTPQLQDAIGGLPQLMAAASGGANRAAA